MGLEPPLTNHKTIQNKQFSIWTSSIYQKLDSTIPDIRVQTIHRPELQEVICDFESLFGIRVPKNLSSSFSPKNRHFWASTSQTLAAMKQFAMANPLQIGRFPWEILWGNSIAIEVRLSVNDIRQAPRPTCYGCDPYSVCKWIITIFLIRTYVLYIYIYLYT